MHNFRHTKRYSTGKTAQQRSNAIPSAHTRTICSDDFSRGSRWSTIAKTSCMYNNIHCKSNLTADIYLNVQNFIYITPIKLLLLFHLTSMAMLKMTGTTQKFGPKFNHEHILDNG